MSTITCIDDFVEGHPPIHLKELLLLGPVAGYAYQQDTRFSYYLYVPWDYLDIESLDLFVCIHGSYRCASEQRTTYSKLAEELNCIVLAPLFPAAVLDPNDYTDYKNIRHHDIHYDEILLGIIEEVKLRYRKVQTSKFMMYGFSGGAQFVLRFTYLYPERVKAICVASPGSVTYLDDTKPFPSGISNFKEMFGKSVDIHALQQIPVQLIVGGLDTSTEYMRALGRPVGPNPLNRLQSLSRLQANLKENGMQVDLCIVKDVGHDDTKWVDVVEKFFTKTHQQH